MGFPDCVFLMLTARSQALAWHHIDTSFRLLYSCRGGWQRIGSGITHSPSQSTWNEHVTSGFSQKGADRSFPFQDTIQLFLATHKRSDHVYRSDLMHTIQSEQREYRKGILASFEASSQNRFPPIGIVFL